MTNLTKDMASDNSEDSWILVDEKDNLNDETPHEETSEGGGDDESAAAQLREYRLKNKMKHERELRSMEYMTRQWEKKEMEKAKEESEKLETWRENTARLQFRFTDGSCETHHFPAETSLGEVYEFARTSLRSQLQHSTVSLTTLNPRRDLDTENMNSSLKMLGLSSATVLVLPQPRTSDQGVGIISLILVPIQILWSMVLSLKHKFIQLRYSPESDQSNQEENENKKRRIHTGPKRRKEPGSVEKLSFFVFLILLLILLLFTVIFFGISGDRFEIAGGVSI